MKKRILLLIAMLLMCLPLNTFAVEGYESKNLEETFSSEEIDANLENYEEADNKITIYMFRGQGCSHCQDFLNFLSSIVSEYGQYFNFESFEVWNDSNNSNLLTIVSSLVDGSEPGGVPYIVIGNKSFIGYASDYDEDIKQAIVDLYNSEDAYDVMNHLDEYEGEIVDVSEDEETNSSNGNVATWIFVGAVTIACVVLSQLMKKSPEIDEADVVIKEVTKEEIKSIEFENLNANLNSELLNEKKIKKEIVKKSDKKENLNKKEVTNGKKTTKKEIVKNKKEVSDKKETSNKKANNKNNKTKKH